MRALACVILVSHVAAQCGFGGPPDSCEMHEKSAFIQQSDMKPGVAEAQEAKRVAAHIIKAKMQKNANKWDIGGWLNTGMLDQLVKKIQNACENGKTSTAQVANFLDASIGKFVEVLHGVMDNTQQAVVKVEDSLNSAQDSDANALALKALNEIGGKVKSVLNAVMTVLSIVQTQAEKLMGKIEEISSQIDGKATDASATVTEFAAQLNDTIASGEKFVKSLKQMVTFKGVALFSLHEDPPTSSIEDVQSRAASLVKTMSEFFDKPLTLFMNLLNATTLRITEDSQNMDDVIAGKVNLTTDANADLANTMIGHIGNADEILKGQLTEKEAQKELRALQSSAAVNSPALMCLALLWSAIVFM